jgi:DNase/tRNase domain of colicin-like bacteriocin
MQMVEIEQEAVGLASNRLPADYKGRWENPLDPGTGRWYPNKEHAAYKYCGDCGIPYKNGYPNFTELALPGGEVNLLPGKKIVIDGVEKDVAMLGQMGDFELADALGAQMTKMKDADAFRIWRLNRGLTWHHRENGLTMQLVWTELHASIPHIGGASLQRGVKVP